MAQIRDSSEESTQRAITENWPFGTINCARIFRCPEDLPKPQEYRIDHRTNTFYHLKVQAIDSRIRIFVTDTNRPVLDVQDGTFAGGMIGVRDYCTDGDQSRSSFSNLAAGLFTQVP